MSNSIKNKKILIIDFDLINNNIQNLLKKENKINQKIINNKNEYSIKINSKNEYFLLKNIIKIDKNLDLLEGLDELYYLEKLDIKNIFLELNKIKNNYDYIFIDTYSEILFNENLEILNNCDDIIFLLKLNELELNKAKVMFNIIKNKWKINKNRIKIIIYRNKIFDYIFYYKYIKKYIKENYSEYKEMSENDEQNYNTKENKKNIIKKNNEMDNEEKYRSLYKNYKKLSEKIYKNKWDKKRR